MTNLRELAESDLATSLESSKDFALPVVLTSPDGATETAWGQVGYDTRDYDPESGAEIIVNRPFVVLRRSTLSRVPADGEKWSVRIPVSPSASAPTETYLLERPVEHGRSIGFINLYLMKASQS